MKTLNALALVALFALASCQKESSQQDPSSPVQINNFSEITAPDGFDFNATRSVSLNFSVDNPGYQQAYTIEVYDQNPQAGGDLIFKGFTKNDRLINAVMVASTAKRLFVVMKDPTGASITEIVEIKGLMANHTFGKKSGRKKAVVVSPNCNSGCNYSYNNKNGNFNINSNDPAGVYCFTGNTTASINVNRSGVTVRLCGTADIQNLNLANGSFLQIIDAADVTVKNLGVNSGSQVDIYNATVTIDNNFSPNGHVTNHGNLSIDKSLNVNNGSGFTNNGTVNIENHLNNNDSLINNGSITVGGNANLNGGSITSNSCKLIVTKELRINNNIENYGYIEAGKDIKINGGSDLNLHNGAMVYGKEDSHINTNIDGTSATSVLKIDGDVQINGGAGISGNLELCVGGSFTNNGSINSPAILACGGTYIPTSTCNPAGNGTPTVVDIDGDNVPDASDLFPNDPERAGEIYFPGSNTFGTIAFEDLWPAMGDYDFNDLVLDYRARFVLDADNKIKDIEISYKVRAIGAGFRNGFGLQIDVPASAVQSITRSTAVGNLISLNANGTEAGQSKAVLILFEKATDELPNPGSAFVNTLPSAPYSAPKVSQAMVTFTNAQSAQVINMNPFIFVNQDRSKEIHMPYTAPTDLADASLFGTGVDNSNPGDGRYYVTKNNQPWVIVLPTSFDYPSEKIDIVQAYNNFASWALSGGSSHTDWYANTAGYRNEASIY